MKKEIKQQRKDFKKAGRMQAKGANWTDTPISKYYDSKMFSDKKYAKLTTMERRSYTACKKGKK